MNYKSTLKNIISCVFLIIALFTFTGGTAESSTFTINAIPWGHVYLDGEKADQDGPETPIIKYPISRREHIIEVKREGFKTFKKKVKVVKGEEYVYSARLPMLFDRKNLNLNIIFGEKEWTTMNNIALIVGPEILEEEYYKDIIKYVKGFSDVDTVMLYSYEENSKDELTDKFKTRINRFLKFSKNVKVSYFNRYMKTEEEIEELRKVMQPFEKEKTVEYLGSCIFE